MQKVLPYTLYFNIHDLAVKLAVMSALQDLGVPPKGVLCCKC